MLPFPYVIFFPAKIMNQSVPRGMQWVIHTWKTIHSAVLQIPNSLLVSENSRPPSCTLFQVSRFLLVFVFLFALFCYNHVSFCIEWCAPCFFHVYALLYSVIFDSGLWAFLSVLSCLYKHDIRRHINLFFVAHVSAIRGFSRDLIVMVLLWFHSKCFTWIFWQLTKKWIVHTSVDDDVIRDFIYSIEDFKNKDNST